MRVVGVVGAGGREGVVGHHQRHLVVAGEGMMAVEAAVNGEERGGVRHRGTISGRPGGVSNSLFEDGPRFCLKRRRVVSR